MRIASAAGAAPIVILVERVPPGLSAAIERLRADRLPVRLARGAEEAIGEIEVGDRLLVIADGAIADPEELERLTRADGAVVLTVPDGAFGEPHERIDADSRWAGLAAIDVALLQETAAMLQDWDLQSTLLRRSLQTGARHLAAERPVIIADSLADLAAAESQIVRRAGEAGGGWAAWLLRPAERLATYWLMESAVGARTAGLGAAGLAIGAVVAFAYGWRWPGLALLLAATPLEGLARRLADIRMQEEVLRGWWPHALPLLSGGALLALANDLALERGWGMVLLALVTIAFLVALAIETTRPVRGQAWLAERRGMSWLLLPFAVLGLWDAGLALLFAYAAGSFFWAQREAHRPPQED